MLSSIAMNIASDRDKLLYKSEVCVGDTTVRGYRIKMSKQIGGTALILTQLEGMKDMHDMQSPKKSKQLYRLKK